MVDIYVIVDVLGAGSSVESLQDTGTAGPSSSTLSPFRAMRAPFESDVDRKLASRCSATLVVPMWNAASLSARYL